MLVLSIPRIRHCELLTQTFWSKHSAAVYHSCLSNTTHDPSGHRKSCPLPRWQYLGNCGFFCIQNFRTTRFWTKWWFAKHMTKHSKIWPFFWEEEGWGKKGERHQKSMWNVLIYKRNMCVVNFVLRMHTQPLEMKPEDVMSQSAGDTQMENREPKTSEQTQSGICLHQIWNDQHSEVVQLGCLKKQLSRISYFKFLPSSVC